MKKSIGKFRILGELDGEKRDLYFIFKICYFIQFRIRRGTDESNVESLAEAADPIIVEKNKSNNAFIQEK